MLAKRSVTHTWQGVACTFVGYEFTDICPYVRLRFEDGSTKQVKAWELVPPMSIYPRTTTKI
jgi:hypothetical protein